MKVYSVEGIQNRIKDLENSLAYLEKEDNWHSINSAMAWLCGVPANIAKPIADSIYNSPLGERVPGLKKAYEFLGKMIEIDNDPEKKETLGKLSDLAELANTLEDDDDGDARISLIKAMDLVNKGDREGALKELLGNFVPDLPDVVQDGMDVADGIETAKGNQKEWSEQRNDIIAQISKHRDDLNSQIRAEKNKLYHLTGGRLGELNTGPQSPNVFTRIDELLEEINMKLQRFQTNIQV
jgi:hypothetical protein